MLAIFISPAYNCGLVLVILQAIWQFKVPHNGAKANGTDVVNNHVLAIFISPALIDAQMKQTRHISPSPKLSKQK